MRGFHFQRYPKQDAWLPHLNRPEQHVYRREKPVGYAARERQKGEVTRKFQRCKVGFRLMLFRARPAVGALHENFVAFLGRLLILLRIHLSVAFALHEQGTAEENDGREGERTDKPADNKP